jgi:hypothetical protein
LLSNSNCDASYGHLKRENAGLVDEYDGQREEAKLDIKYQGICAALETEIKQAVAASTTIASSDHATQMLHMRRTQLSTILNQA